METETTNSPCPALTICSPSPSTSSYFQPLKMQACIAHAHAYIYLRVHANCEYMCRACSDPSSLACMGLLTHARVELVRAEGVRAERSPRIVMDMSGYWQWIWVSIGLRDAEFVDAGEGVQSAGRLGLFIHDRDIEDRRTYFPSGKHSAGFDTMFDSVSSPYSGTRS